VYRDKNSNSIEMLLFNHLLKWWSVIRRSSYDIFFVRTITRFIISTLSFFILKYLNTMKWMMKDLILIWVSGRTQDI
jgi:hypothetical protein